MQYPTSSRSSAGRWQIVSAVVAVTAIALYFVAASPPNTESAEQAIHTTEAAADTLTRRPQALSPDALAGFAQDIEPDLPSFMQPRFLEASLEALANNGADLTRPMPSNHWVRTRSQTDAQEIARWGAANGFDASEPTIFLGHGGEEFFEIALTRLDVPVVAQIQQQGRAIKAGLSAFDDARYTTWVGAINKSN